MWMRVCINLYVLLQLHLHTDAAGTCTIPAESSDSSPSVFVDLQAARAVIQSFKERQGRETGTTHVPSSRPITQQPRIVHVLLELNASPSLDKSPPTRRVSAGAAFLQASGITLPHAPAPCSAAATG